MNDGEDLPGGHFWDSAEAEQEYYEIGKRIEEAGHRAREAAVRAHCEYIIASILERAYFRAQHNKSFDDDPLTYTHGNYVPGSPSIGSHLPLNPWWIPPDGWFSSEWAGSPLSTVSRQIGDRLTLHEAKTVPIETFYAYKSSFGGYRMKLVKYATFRRVEWYILPDDAAMSNIEWALRYAKGLIPPKITVGPPFNAPPFNAEEDVKVAADQALSRRDELIREVRSFLSTYRKWKFMPWIPPEVREARLVPDLPPGLPERTEDNYYPKPTYSSKASQSPEPGGAVSVPDLPEGDSILAVVPLSTLEIRQTPPKIGQRWADPYWIGMGQWTLYQFAGEEEWRERLERGFHKRLVAALQEAYRAKDMWDQLCRQREAIRVLHYKPEIYKAFWSILQATEV